MLNCYLFLKLSYEFYKQPDVYNFIDHRWQPSLINTSMKGEILLLECPVASEIFANPWDYFQRQLQLFQPGVNININSYRWQGADTTI